MANKPQHIRDNERKTCKACGVAQRSGMSPLCARCHYYIKRYGDWQARPLKICDITESMNTAGTIVSRNIEHPAVLQVRSAFLEWVKRSKINWKLVANGWALSKFDSGGHEFPRVLQICLALYLEYHVNRNWAFANSTTSLYYQMANRAVLQFFPNPANLLGSVTKNQRQELAIQIQQAFGGLLAAMLAAHIQKNTFTERLEKKLATTPLEV